MIFDLIHSEVKYIMLDPDSGAEVSLVVHEALRLAITNNICVRVIHNDREFIIDPKKILQWLFEQGMA